MEPPSLQRRSGVPLADIFFGDVASGDVDHPSLVSREMTHSYGQSTMRAHDPTPDYGRRPILHCTTPDLVVALRYAAKP